MTRLEHRNILEKPETLLICSHISRNDMAVAYSCPKALPLTLRRLTEEELEFILVHEDPRKVLKTGSITCYGQYYRVSEDYIARRVWTKLKGETLFIESGKKS